VTEETQSAPQEVLSVDSPPSLQSGVQFVPVTEETQSAPQEVLGIDSPSSSQTRVQFVPVIEESQSTPQNVLSVDSPSSSQTRVQFVPVIEESQSTPQNVLSVDSPSSPQLRVQFVPVIEETQSPSQEILSVCSHSSSQSGFQLASVIEEVQSAPQEVLSVDSPPSSQSRVQFVPGIEEIQSVSVGQLDSTPPHFTVMNDTVSANFLWRDKAQFVGLKKCFDPNDPIMAWRLVHTLNHAWHTNFTIADMPFKEPTILEHMHKYKIDDKLGSVDPPSEHWNKPVTSSDSDDAEEKRIKEGTLSLRYQNLYDDPEDLIAQYGCDPDDFLNNSDGYLPKPRIPRTIMISRTKDLASIWKQVEDRYGIPRSCFSLVSNSHYLDQEGEWFKEIDNVEIRFRGNGAGPYIQAPFVHPSYRIEVEQDNPKKKVSFDGPVTTRMISAELKRLGWIQPVLCRVIDGEDHVIPDEGVIVGGKISVTLMCGTSTRRNHPQEFHLERRRTERAGRACTNPRGNQRFY
jgi:hypothetical protein